MIRLSTLFLLHLATVAAVAQTPSPYGPLPAPASKPPAAKASAEPQYGHDRVPGFEEAQRVRDSVAQFIRAYEAGDALAIEGMLDPALIGYQLFVDGVRRNANALKDLRIQLLDTQVTVSPDLAVVQTGWEKRFIDVTTFQPGLFTGRATLLLHKDKDRWKLAAVDGDNPFSDASGTTARLSISPAVLVPPPGGCVVGACPPLQLEIIDADLAGQPSVRAELITRQGERELVTLNQTSLGRFVLNTVPLEIGGGITPTPGNGVVSVNSSAGTQPITLRFLDQNPGGNRPPSTLSASAQVQGTPPVVGIVTVNPVAMNAATIPESDFGVPIALSITVTDPDRAGAPSVTVQLQTTTNPPATDVETITLPATGFGVFSVNSVIMRRAVNPLTIFSNNGTVEFPVFMLSPATLTIRYQDSNPATTVTANVSVIPL
jgi:ketosteroid isomerase-like protein